MPINIEIKNQPDQTSCGPTSLQAIYSYWKDEVCVKQIMDETTSFENGGGTLAVILGTHALKRGYKVKLYSYNIDIFDPSWFEFGKEALLEKLKKCLDVRQNSDKARIAIENYIHYLELGGILSFQDLNIRLIRKYLDRKIPVLTGLSSTWLYKAQRENPLTCEDDDIHGHPAGHFVVIYGYKDFKISVADPYKLNPINGSNYYTVNAKRLINSILLGITTYDGNLLVVEKGKK